MNYYPHHIGDFNNATRHLTRVERSVYRDIIDLYYDTESPLKNDIKLICRKIIAVSEDEVTAVEQVLNEFFTVVNGCYENARCKKTIDEYQNSISNKSKAGKASAKARKAAKSRKPKAKKAAEKNLTGVEQVLNRCSTGVDNQEPRTKNQEPITKCNSRAKLDYSSWPNLPCDQVLNDYKKLRRDKRAPITQTVINSMGIELSKIAEFGVSVDQSLIICCERGWQGLKCDWVLNHLEIISKDNSGNSQNSRTLAGNIQAAEEFMITMRQSDE